MNGDKKIRIVIADDHTMFREAMIVLLERQRDLQVVGAAADGLEALRAAEKTCPHVLLLDLVMPGSDGLSVIPEIRRRCPSTKVIILTGYFDQDLVLRALRAGAVGYVIKTSPPAELTKAIRAVHAGDAWIERSVVGRLLDHFPIPKDHGNDDTREAQPITPREMQVAELVAIGLSNKEIAHRLTVGETTIKAHLASIFRKLQIRHRLQLALYAREQNRPAFHPAAAGDL